MEDDIVRAFIKDVVEGKAAPLPKNYIMEDVVVRAIELCPDTPHYIFDELLSLS